MKKVIIIAPVGDDLSSLFSGIKEFPTEMVYLLVPKGKDKDADQAKKELEKFNIPVKKMHVVGNLWESTFMAVSEIRKIVGEDKELLVNVGTGDKLTRCASTSAAFVNGLKAFDMMGDEPWMLPVMKFSYYKMLTDKKMDILKLLYKKSFESMEELANEMKMSLPLMSYHINGNLKSEGLKQLGMVMVSENKGRVKVELTMMGRLIVKGYIE